MSWQSCSLGELVDIKGGGTPSRTIEAYWGGGIPWATVKDFKENVLLETEETISELGAKESATNIISKGTIIIPTRMALGKVAIAGKDVAINQDLKTLVLKNPQPITKNFLFWFLRHSAEEFERAGKGATVKGITVDFLKDVQVPLPPLATQQHIARVLEQADQLRKQAQQMERELDQMAQSLFMEMFGDPVKNLKRWPIEVLGKYLEAIDSGWSPKCEERAAVAGEWGVLKLGAVTSCVYKEAENKKLPSDLSPRQKIEVRKGDLLFSRKNTYELVAATAYVRNTQGRIMLSDLIFRLVPKTSLDAVYLWGLLSNPTFRAEVQMLAGGAAGSMPNISKAKLAEKKFPLPNLDTQLKYAKAVREFWKYSDVVNMKIHQLDDLFNALMQRAFNGELTAPVCKAA